MWTPARGVPGLVAIGMLVDPSRPLPFEICLWKRLFDLECLTCGLTRAVCSALQLDFAASWAYHPAGIGVAAVLVVAASREFILSALPSAAGAPPVLRG